MSANNVVSSNDVIEALRQKLSDANYENAVMTAQIRGLSARVEELESEIRDMKTVRDLEVTTKV
jgi:chaperonin cofactor prefoldin